MFSQVIAVALCALIAQPAMAAKCTRTYTVKEGDYCDSISAAQNVSTYQLAVNNVNHINADCSDLEAGQVLCLGTQGHDCQTTHVVGAGDTCDGIDSAAGVNITLLVANNPQINEQCSNIYIGEVLCTATTVIVPPAPSGAKSVSIPSSTPAPSSNGDDENIPYCDEL